MDTRAQLASASTCCTAAALEDPRHRPANARLQRDPHPSIDGEGPRWSEGPWIGQIRRRIGKRSRVEQRACGVKLLIEEILNKPVDLHLLADLVGRVQAEHRITWQLGKCAILIAGDDLA